MVGWLFYPSEAVRSLALSPCMAFVTGMRDEEPALADRAFLLTAPVHALVSLLDESTERHGLCKVIHHPLNFALVRLKIFFCRKLQFIACATFCMLFNMACRLAKWSRLARSAARASDSLWIWRDIIVSDSDSAGLIALSVEVFAGGWSHNYVSVLNTLARVRRAPVGWSKRDVVVFLILVGGYG